MCPWPWHKDAKCCEGEGEEFRSRNVRNKTKMPRNKTNTKKAQHTHKQTHTEDVNDAANSLTTHIHAYVLETQWICLAGCLPSYKASLPFALSFSLSRWNSFNALAATLHATMCQRQSGNYQAVVAHSSLSLSPPLSLSILPSSRPPPLFPFVSHLEITCAFFMHSSKWKQYERKIIRRISRLKCDYKLARRYSVILSIFW